MVSTMTRYNPHDDRADLLDARADELDSLDDEAIQTHNATTYYPRCLTCGRQWTNHDTPDNRCPFSESPWLGVECG